MTRIHRASLSALSALLAVTALTVGSATTARADDKDGKKPKGTFQAQRAGWMLGMYVGEEKGQPFPFILQVAEGSDAKAKGVRPGDELMKFDNLEANTSLSRIFERANELRPNRTIQVWVRRGSQPMRIDLVVPKNVGASVEVGKTDAAKGAETKEKDKKKRKKDRPVVIKPIPAPDR